VEFGYMALEYFVLPEKLRPDVVQSASSDVSSTGTADRSKKAAYQVILARNLFAAASGGEVERPVVHGNLEGMAASHLDILLLGTIDDQEGGNRAVILDKKTSKQHIHRQGEEIEGVVIKEIRRGKVVLVVKGREAILDMSEAAKQRPLVAARIGGDNQTAFGDGAAALPETSTGEQPRAEEAVQQPPAPESTSSQKKNSRIFRPKITRPGKSSVTQ
jgi:type II secretory pathway component PulC